MDRRRNAMYTVDRCAQSPGRRPPTRVGCPGEGSWDATPNHGNQGPTNATTTQGAFHTGGLHWRAWAPGEVTAAAESQRGCRCGYNTAVGRLEPLWNEVCMATMHLELSSVVSLPTHKKSEEVCTAAQKGGG